MQIRPTRYDSADAQALIEQVQQEYIVRYGGRDRSPVDPGQFHPPRGLLAIGREGPEPVAIGGWRRHNSTDSGGLPGRRPAEIKRMYVNAAVRGRGLARELLGYLEQSARDAGVDWLVLETGQRQPEALALYRSSGYIDVPHFGFYADAPMAVHLGKAL